MNVASLDNCKKLHELSGWEQKGSWWVNYDLAEWHIQPHLDQELDSIPAYTLGYLIRKLPEMVALYKEPKGWLAKQYFDEPFSEDSGYCNTPENATILLCIKLFEEGILK